MSNRIYKLLINNGYEMNETVFQYGYKTISSYFVFLLICFLITFLISTSSELLIFLVCFIPLKRFVGGGHFSKSYLCMCASISVSILSSYLISILVISPILFYFVSFCLLFIISKIGIIDTKNKRLSSNEKNTYLKYSKSILLAYLVISIFSYLYRLDNVWNALFIVETIILFTILAGKYLDNRSLEENN